MELTEEMLEMAGYRKISRTFRDGIVSVAGKCSKCHKIKWSEEFYKHNDGLSAYCKPCSLVYKRENKEMFARHVREWVKRNPEKARENGRIRAAKRAARKRGLPDTLTETQQTQILRKYEYSCALTGEEWSWDHAIPLASGHGGTTYENMYPLRNDLNNSKNDRNLFDWFYANKEHHNLPQAKFDALIEYLAEINGMTVDEYEAHVRWCHDNPRKINEEGEDTAS